MMIELAVKISNSESRLTKKFTVYDCENVRLSKDDTILKPYVEEALKEFEVIGAAEDVLLTIKMTW